jgi:enterochelin esterase family protein
MVRGIGRIALFVSILHYCVSVHTVFGDEISEIQSPRIRALGGEIEKGKTKAVTQFWKEMEAAGTPLVESIEGDPNHVHLTLVWRGDRNTENVLLVGGLARGDSLDNTLEQLGDTDVWYRTYWTRNDLRATYRFSPNDSLVEVPMDDLEAVAAQRKNYRRDPLNPGRGGKSLIELPDAPVQRWIVRNDEAPKGETRTQKGFKSAILGNERRIGVYVPPGYDPEAAPYPMFLIFDLSTYTTVIPTPAIINNLIHAKKIQPSIVVMVGNAPGARNEELPCNEKFAEFLVTELMPWVRQEYNVSTDPSMNVIAGSSFGGLAASFVALRHPEIFGNVLSQSGSYWWSPDTNSSYLAPEVEGEWLTRQYAKEEKKAIRFFIESGLNESGRPSMVITNRHFRDVLNAKGYEIVQYDEFNGGHDVLNWRGSLGEGLIALIGK